MIGRATSSAPLSNIMGLKLTQEHSCNGARAKQIEESFK